VTLPTLRVLAAIVGPRWPARPVRRDERCPSVLWLDGPAPGSLPPGEPEALAARGLSYHPGRRRWRVVVPLMSAGGAA